MQQRFKHAVLFPVLVIPCLTLLPFVAYTERQAAGLREQLTKLADQHGFAVKGLERLGDEREKPVAGELRKRLAALLSDYSFLLLEDGQGNLRAVHVLGHHPAQPDPSSAALRKERPPAAPAGERSDTIKTTRYQSHHYAKALLTGPNGQTYPLNLLIDTGATTVVLPASLSETLGFRSEDLRPGWAQTAGGRIPVQWGLLAAVQVGDVMVKDVEVSFMADPYLDNQKILGMSFLRNFRISLDDQNGELILFTR